MDIKKLLAQAEKTRSDISARSGGFNRPVRPPMGQSRWRILPPWRKDSGLLHRTFGSHFIKDTKGTTLGAVVCEHISAEEVGAVTCKFCEELAAVRRLTKDDDEIAALNEFRAAENYLFNAVRIDGKPDEKDKAILLSLPKSLSNDFYVLLENYAADGVVVVDPEEGHDIVITREGMKFNTKYSLTPAVRPSAVSKAALDSIINIDEYIAGEIKRNKSNEAKFTPALSAMARNVGISSASVAEALSGGAFAVGKTEKLAVASDSYSKAPAETGRVIDANETMPWEDKEAFSKPKATEKAAEKALTEEEMLRQIEEEVAGMSETPETSASPAEEKSEQPKAEAPKSSPAGEESVEDLLAGI